MSRLAKVDGRHLRSERTRRAIVGAVLELVDGGTPAPTAQQIATRAGVGLRSIRVHFRSREDLLLAAADEHARRLAQAAEPTDPRAPFDERLARFVRSRARALEASAAMRRSASLLRDASKVVEQAVTRLGRLRRREAEAAFAAELAARHGAERAVLLDALDLVTSGATWDALRRDQGRSARGAEEVMAHLLRSLFPAVTRG